MIGGTKKYEYIILTSLLEKINYYYSNYKREYFLNIFY